MRTDLAMESKTESGELSGVREECAYKSGLEIRRIDVVTEEAAQRLDKPIGRYVSVKMPAEYLMDRGARELTGKTLAKELKALYGEKRNALVIGLGNRYITADALGTKTAEYVLVTRHIHLHMADVLPKGTPKVAAFCANVLGVTGLETAEVVTALTEQIRPELVVFIDSLAAARTEHLGCLIQCNDSGIAPGAGVGNFRQSLTKQLLGVPVVALGVPLVVSAEAILNESGQPTDETLRDLIVTPKDIDAMVRDASRILSDAINLSLYGDSYPELEKLLR